MSGIVVTVKCLCLNWIWFLLLCCYSIGSTLGNPAAGEHGASDPGGGDAQDGGSDGDSHGNGSGHHEERFQVAKFDFAYVKTPFIVGVWILYATAAKLFFHWEKHLKIFPESCLLIILGVIFGVFLYVAGEKAYELNTNIFFLVLLPPIILDAGYYMPARAFFDQLGTILLYAIMGTLINNLMLGFALWGVYEGKGFEFENKQPLLLLHALVLGSLLAAVDPVAVLAVFESVHVNEMLYIIVFGESLLNDGISVVLYHLFEGYSEIGRENIQGVDIIAGIASFFIIVFGATGIGMLLGLFGGFMSRFTKHVRKMEPLLVLVIGYLSFVIAEMFHLSGIISCTFCGITMRKYVECNYSEKSQKTIHILLKMFAQASETIVFMYIGITAVSDMHHWNTAFCILTLIFCLIFRTVGVIVQTYFANLIRVVKLTKIDQFVMAYGGLRGAIAFALVLLLDPHGFPHRRMFITSTVLVIYFTNIAMGSTIEPLVKFLKVKRQVDRKPTMGEKITTRFVDHVMGGLEDITCQRGHHLFRERFSTWNNNFLKPLIVGRSNPQRRGFQILNVYNQINQKMAKKHLHGSKEEGHGEGHGHHNESFLFRDMSSLDLSRASSTAHLIDSPTSNHTDPGLYWWDSTSNLTRQHESSNEKVIAPDGVVLDFRSLEIQDSKKMRDASKTHHISEDMAGPIMLVSKEKKRNLADSRSSEPQPPIYVIQNQFEQLPAGFVYGDGQEFQDLAPMSSSTLDNRSRKIVSFAKPEDESIQKPDAHSLPEPWKRADDGVEHDPVFSPAARSHPPAPHQAAVQYDNLGFPGADDQAASGRESSASSSGSGSHDDGNVNNNNNRVLRRWRSPDGVRTSDDGDQALAKGGHDRGMDIEMKEIVLDPLRSTAGGRIVYDSEEEEEEDYDRDFRKTYSKFQ